jgi:hypothetical protein
MKIIGCDFHPSYQQIAMVDRESLMEKIKHTAADTSSQHRSL